MKIFNAEINVLKYKIFDSTEDFEAWQKLNKGINGENITSIIPINRTLVIDKIKGSEIATNFVGILIVYWE